MLPFHMAETIDTDSSGSLRLSVAKQKQAILDIFTSQVQDSPEESALCKLVLNLLLCDAKGKTLHQTLMGFTSQ